MNNKKEKGKKFVDTDQKSNFSFLYVFIEKLVYKIYLK